MKRLLLLLLIAVPVMAVTADEVGDTYRQATDSLYEGDLQAAKTAFQTVSAFSESYPELAAASAFMASFIGDMSSCSGTFMPGWRCVGQVQKEEDLVTTQIYFDDLKNSIQYTKIEGLMDLEDMKKRLTERGMQMSSTSIRGRAGYASELMTSDIGTTQKVNIWTDEANSYVVYEISLKEYAGYVHEVVYTGKNPRGSSSGFNFSISPIGILLGLPILAVLVGVFIFKRKKSAPVE